MTRATHLAVVEGEVLDRPQFTNLYRLLDLERSAVEEWQQLSMPAAFEVMAAFEDDQWRKDKQAERNAYIVEHKMEPQWSPSSTESFYRWMDERAKRDGHPPQSRATFQRLKNAAQCVRIVIESNRAAPRGAALPDTEKAWRPVYQLLTHGFTDQIVSVVDRAAEIAQEEGKPINSGMMSTAKAEIWKTDPAIRAWVEQPGQQENRSKHDRAVTLFNMAKAAADALKKSGDAGLWKSFYDYIWEQGT